MLRRRSRFEDRAKYPFAFALDRPLSPGEIAALARATGADSLQVELTGLKVFAKRAGAESASGWCASIPAL